MQECANLLDQYYQTTLYQDALDEMQQRIDQSKSALSAQVVQDTLKHGGTWSFGSVLAEQHAQTYTQYPLSAEKLAYFKQLAQQSLQQQYQLEQESSVSFEDYLAQFR